MTQTTTVRQTRPVHDETRYDDRAERAARNLAHFEDSDAFNGPETAERRTARSEYRARTAALLARTDTVNQDRHATAKPADHADTALGLSFSRKVTSAQLAALSPGEITALFGALRTIASITQPTAAPVTTVTLPEQVA